MIDYEWIREHGDGTNNAALCREYNAAHGTEIDHRLFNYHCKRAGIRSRGRKYAEEEKTWLKENYPQLGQKETARRFAELFGRDVSPKTITKYCNVWLGCGGVTEQRRNERYDAMRSEIGTLTVNCRGEARIKTEHGWIKATHSQVDVPKGMIAFNLDGDIYNNAPENIGITTNGKFRTLRNNGFWSKDREITKTGLLWCDLNELVQSQKEGGRT